MSYLGVNHETGPALNSVESLRSLSVDVAAFAEDPLLGARHQAAIIVKRTNQGERDRFIRTQMELTGADAVSVIRSDTLTNQYYPGLIAVTDLGVSRLDAGGASRSQVYLQPTAAAYDILNDELLIGSANEIHRLDPDLVSKGSFRHPWFARLHTIDRIPGSRDALVTSASMDMLHFINLDSQALVGEFSMWERFPCYNAEGRLVLRQDVTPDFPVTEPESNILRVAPDGLGLHHSRLPLHINSAIMAAPGRILFTTFKTGKLYEYDLNTGRLLSVFEGMGAPHSILRTKDGFVVTDTTGENIINLRPDYSVASSYNFSGLPGKKPGLDAERWLQSAVPMERGLVAAVDSPRGALHLIDTEQKTRRTIPFDPDWAVQTLIGF
jgi:hypothetical protein